MKNLYCIFVAVACLMPSMTNGQTDGNNNDASQKQRKTSAIFDEIMQTLPNDMKAKVDSASTIKKKNAGGQTSSSSNSGNQKAPAAANRDDALKQLPDDVRQRVEKAISDIDVSNQDRQILFKDSKKRSAGR
jgi:Ni/Co efflux regulator RcnB